MPYYSVSYQLNKKKDYQKLWDELHRLGGHKVMQSFYFLDVTSKTASDLLNHLSEFVDDDDQIAVVEITKKPAYQMPNKGTNDWVKERF